MFRTAAIVLLLAAGGGGCDGCQGKKLSMVDASTTLADAALDAKVVETVRPWQATVAARILGYRVDVDRIRDGVVVRSGLYVYGVKPDGSLERIGAPANYAAFLGDEASEL